MPFFFCARNVSIDSSRAGHMQNIKCFQIKSEDSKVEYINVVEAHQMEDNTANKHSQMLTSYQTSAIKIEETQIDTVNLKQTDDTSNERGKDKPVKCPLCDHVARNHYSLFYHKRSVHMTEEEKFKCQFCSYNSIFKYSLFTHIKHCHRQLIKSLKAKAERNGESSTTNKDASTSSALNTKLPIQEENYSEEGEYSSDDNIPLQKMVKTSTSNSKIHTRENKKQSSDEEFIKKLLNIKKIRNHKKQGTQVQKKRQCDICGKIYNNYDALYSHKQIHKTEEEQLPCPHCKKKFKRKSELKIHVKRIHEPKVEITEKPFKCSDCSFATITHSQLKIHTRMYHTSRPFKCDVCSKSFTRRDVLKVHSYSHSNITFECDICSRSFKRKDFMVDHKRRHNMEKEECKDCGRLIKHMKIHKGKCKARKK